MVLHICKIKNCQGWIPQWHFMLTYFLFESVNLPMIGHHLKLTFIKSKTKKYPHWNEFSVWISALWQCNSWCPGHWLCIHPGTPRFSIYQCTLNGQISQLHLIGGQYPDPEQDSSGIFPSSSKNLCKYLNKLLPNIHWP